MTRSGMRRSRDAGAAVAAIAAGGERTLVLHGAGPAGRAAARMLPDLPEVCFVQTDADADVGEALRYAVEHGLDRLILLATVEGLTSVHATDDLGGITADMGGSPELAAEVAGAGSARRGYELWARAGLLGRCGRELCRRVADRLEHTAARIAADTDRSPVAAQVVLLDLDGERMIGMYGRLRR